MQKQMDWHRNVKNLPKIRASQKGNYTITCHFDWLCLRVPLGGPTGHLAPLRLPNTARIEMQTLPAQV
jgi:hypothetical protein